MENQKETFVEKELRILSELHPDPNNRPIIAPLFEEIEMFVASFHEKMASSGASIGIQAAAVTQAIRKLILSQPIAPLTGEDYEWFETSGGNIQNARCSAVFKREDGRCHYLDAIRFYRIENGQRTDEFTGMVGDISSAQNIKSFPFKPKTFDIEVFRVEADNLPNQEDKRVVECGTGDYVYFIKNSNDLIEVFEYYDFYKR